MQTDANTPYRQVQGLQRGLNILRALNDVNATDATPREISERTSLNRTTVKRLLETLTIEGYVRRNEAEGTYGLTPDVMQLSRGLANSERLTDARLLQRAVPLLDEVAEETGWCLSLATLKDSCMVVRKTTQHRSELAAQIDLRRFQQLPILFSALGRAYFSDCEDTERTNILRRLQCGGDAQVAIARNPRLVELLTQRVRKQGYAIQDGDWPGETKYGAVAVPVHGRGGPIGSLSVVYLRRGVSESTIVDEFVPRLKSSTALLAEAA